MKVDKKIKTQRSNWKFDKSVVKNFDKHINQSVPFYKISHDLTLKLTDFFLKKKSVCYDLGCSTGILLKEIDKRHNSKNINFYESKKPTGMNSIINIKENHSLIKKNQISLDNFVNEKKIKPDLIKIDAEGSELYILEGAINILKKFKPDIFLSVHKNHLKKLNVSESQIINLIKKYGYKIKDSEEKVTDNLNKNEYYLSC